PYPSPAGFNSGHSIDVDPPAAGERAGVAFELRGPFPGDDVATLIDTGVAREHVFDNALRMIERRHSIEIRSIHGVIERADNIKGVRNAHSPITFTITRFRR